MRFAADEFKAFLDWDDAFHLGEDVQGFEGMVGALVADGGDDRLFSPKDRARVVTELLDLGDDEIDLVARGAGTNDDDHWKIGG